MYVYIYINSKGRKWKSCKMNEGRRTRGRAEYRERACEGANVLSHWTYARAVHANHVHFQANVTFYMLGLAPVAERSKSNLAGTVLCTHAKFAWILDTKQ